MKYLCIVTMTFPDDYGELVAVGMSVASKYPGDFLKLNRTTWFVMQELGETNVAELVSYKLGIKRYGRDCIWMLAVGKKDVPKYPCAFIGNIGQWHGRAPETFWPALHALTGTSVREEAKT